MTLARRYRPLPALIGAAAAVALIAGCGAGAGEAQSGTTLLVTDDFGAATLVDSDHPKTTGGDTVMRLLQRNAKVQTAYGGGFVQGINGKTGGVDRGGARDWFYYVNGVKSPRGAAQWRLRDGERVWWDRRHWSEVPSVEAVVGSFPAPLAGGFDGRSTTVDVRCAAPGATCERVRAALGRIGARPATAAQLDLPRTDKGAPVRVVVGPWTQARRIAPELARLGREPATSGVFARFSADGASLTTFDGNARSVGTDGRATGLVAALREGEGAPVWAVTGTDEQGVAYAAGALNEQALGGRFAVKVSAAGAQPLPASRAAAGSAG